MFVSYSTILLKSTILMSWYFTNLSAGSNNSIGKSANSKTLVLSGSTNLILKSPFFTLALVWKCG